MTKVQTSQLVLVDIQTKLTPAMDKAEMPQVLQNAKILAKAAKLLAVPIQYTEQYSKALGTTETTLASELETLKPIEKINFSCVAEPSFRSRLTQERSQIILAGIEAHICVLQTALALTEMGKQVFIVEDAVTSRELSNKHNAIARLRQAGCIVTNTESVLFEWLGKAGGEPFKTISKLIR